MKQKYEENLECASLMAEGGGERDHGVSVGVMCPNPGLTPGR